MKPRGDGSSARDAPGSPYRDFRGAPAPSRDRRSATTRRRRPFGLASAERPSSRAFGRWIPDEASAYAAVKRLAAQHADGNEYARRGSTELPPRPRAAALGSKFFSRPRWAASLWRSVRAGQYAAPIARTPPFSRKALWPCPCSSPSNACRRGDDCGPEPCGMFRGRERGRSRPAAPGAREGAGF